MENIHVILLNCSCVDINPRAAEIATETGRRNDVVVQPIVCDLIAPFSDRLRGKIDIIVFNPPYVVTPTEEVTIFYHFMILFMPRLGGAYCFRRVRS